MEFKQDQYYPSPWNTQTSPGFAEFGILTIFALKSGITRSIIEQIFWHLSQVWVTQTSPNQFNNTQS